MFLQGAPAITDAGMYGQDQLRAILAHRLTASLDPAGSSSGTEQRPVTRDELEDLVRRAETVAASADTLAVAVVRSFDPASFARSALEFAFGVPTEAATAWYQAFTRTVFLTGNPANLAHRFVFDHVSADGATAWLGPGPADASMALRRMLPLVEAAREPRLPAEITIRTSARANRSGTSAHTLYLATAGVRLPDYLVHMNHVLAEAAVTGLVAPGDEVTVRHVPRLTRMPYALLRVHADTAVPERLRAYAGLVTDS